MKRILAIEDETGLSNGGREADRPHDVASFWCYKLERMYRLRGHLSIRGRCNAKINTDDRRGYRGFFRWLAGRRTKLRVHGAGRLMEGHKENCRDQHAGNKCERSH